MNRELIKIEAKDGELFADSRDVAKILGVEHKNTLELIRKNQEDFQRVTFQTLPFETSGGVQNVTFATIPEFEALLLITYVKNTEEAKKAKRALIEAFQNMRKKITEIPTGSNLLALAVLEAQKQLNQKDAIIESMKPAAQFMADVTGSRDAIEMSQVAKIIGMGYGRNQLFELLREKGVLRHNNEPYQSYVDKGWFRLVEQSWKDSKGETHISIKPIVYQKGIDGIIKIIRSQN